jgi:hypothetical protein
MCKEMPVILAIRVVDPKKNNRKKWRAKEEERHKGLLTYIENGLGYILGDFSPKRIWSPCGGGTKKADFFS